MRLQKAPAGLLGAFDLKVEGRNPPDFGEAIVGTVDVYDQYLAQNQKIDRQTLSIPNPSTQNAGIHTVPAGKCWRLLTVSYTGVLDAADAALTVFAQTRLASDPNNSVVALMEPNGRLATGGANARLVSLAFTLPRPLFLPPGWSVVTVLQLSAAPAVSFSYDSALTIQEFDA